MHISLHLSFFWSESSCWLELNWHFQGCQVCHCCCIPGLDVTRQMAPLFWEWLNWMHQHFRQIVGPFQAKAGSHCSADLHQWDLFNDLVWCAAECSVLGIKSWLCHVNPKEEAALSLVLQEQTRHHVMPQAQCDLCTHLVLRDKEASAGL